MQTLFHRMFAPLLAIAAAAQTQAQDPALPVLAATATEELRAKDGQRVVVYGETAKSGKSQSGINFVNFKGASFTLVAFKSDLGPFKEGAPADLYEGKRLAVTGVISLYKDRPQIKLTSPDQVRVLAAGEAWPAAAKP